MKSKKDNEMKTRYSVGDYAGYGISIGSIIGVIGGVILMNPGAGLISGILLGAALGFLIGRKILINVSVKQQEINSQ